MSRKPIIQIQNLSKKYRIGKKSGDLRESLRNIFSFSKEKPVEIWALKDINFEVNQGEVFGIIGPNGSGKSTLLKILSKITYPTSGKAILRGKVSSLLEVGTGFHPELTGRENIYLNGSILGMKRAEIKKKFDEIVDFSGVEQFIDTPVKHYSSGMYVRLAFSVAAFLEPDILLVDEVLSVGDMSFRQKSMGKMNEVAQSGRTVLFVSHNLNAIKSLCKNGMYLEYGKIKDFGNIHLIVNNYENSVFKDNKIKTEIIGIEDIDLKKITIFENQGKESSFINSGDNIRIEMHLVSKLEIKDIRIRLEFKDKDNNVLFVCNNFLTEKIIDIDKTENVIICHIDKLPLNIGNYFIDLIIVKNHKIIYSYHNAYNFEVTSGNFYKTGNLPSKNKLFLIDHYWETKYK